MSVIKILEEDFKKTLEEINFDKPYDPFSVEFMKPLFIGQLLLGVKAVENDVEEELDGAEKYWDKFQETGDVQYREMAHDELRHAGILIKKHIVNADEKEKEYLNGLEKERQEMLKLVKVEV